MTVAEQKAQHTATPWRLDETFDGRACIRASDKPGGRVIALIERTDETSAANSHLISAAPDLYDALEAVIGLIERMPNANAILEAESGARIVGQARAALAKAGGA